MSAICGVKVTETDVKNAKRRGAEPEDLAGSITELTDDDRRFLTTWFGFGSIVPEVFDIAWMLCEPGSAAEAELDELFEDAVDWLDADQTPTRTSRKPSGTAQVVI